MTVFTHIHASGRFDQSPALFEKGLKDYRSSSSVISVTEVDRNTRARFLTADGWQGVWGDKSPRDDCGITWDPKIWTKVWADTVIVSNATYRNERGHITGKTAAAYAVLKHRSTGKVIVFGALHTPHNMQEQLRGHKPPSDASRAYLAIIKGFRHSAFRLKKKHKADGVCLSGDWNLNLRTKFASGFLKTYAATRGMKLNWTGHMPVRGTMGRAIFDATLYSGIVLRATPKILVKKRGVDHVAYQQSFNL